MLEVRYKDHQAVTTSDQRMPEICMRFVEAPWEMILDEPNPNLTLTLTLTLTLIGGSLGEDIGRAAGGSVRETYVKSL